MERSYRAVLVLLAGIGLLGAGIAAATILIDGRVAALALGAIGLGLIAWSLHALRGNLVRLIRNRRGEIALTTLGLVGVFIAAGYFVNRYPVRFDMTSAGHFSLSAGTLEMLRRLDRPVNIAFFHDPLMRETVELYQLIAASANGRIRLELHDPMLNPAVARLRGVEFAGTAVMESEGRQVRVNGASETDIANGILRVSQGAQRLVCFLDGHGEPDPFSLEQHDHLEGTGGHSHGLGAKYVVHERHGMAKARTSLEAMNYTVEKLSLAGSAVDLRKCTVLVVAGPKTTLLPVEVAAIERFLDAGGNAFFMLDPFVPTGLEPLVGGYGISIDDTIIIDQASHFWTDVSAPAVTDYNRHEVTQGLPLTFFPGARSLSPTRERVGDTMVRPIVNSSRRSFGQSNRERVEFDPAQDRAGPVTIMAIADRRPEFAAATAAIVRELQVPAADRASTEVATVARQASRIAVIGDSDFATNSFFHLMGNGRLFLNTVNYLAARENLIGISPPTYDPPRVSLTNVQMKGTFFLSIVLIPMLMALFGIAVWWRQR